MANDERDRDELDRNEEDDETRGLADDEFEENEGDEEDLEDEEEYDANERITGEVGSEGGSPGDTVVTRRRGEQMRGSEATETTNPEQDDVKTLERVGEDGAPRRRNP
jgi:hypothetical protein